MVVLILGGDGYLGWPTAMHFAAAGHTVHVADNYVRRTIAEATDSSALIETPSLGRRSEIYKGETNFDIKVHILDLNDSELTFDLFRKVLPDVVIHYAEQPSAPYSMRGFKEAQLTFQNNLNVTFNCIWAVKDICPNCHIVKLGTMGEYGTPNIDIEEGWIEIEHKGKKDKFLYPRAGGSLYHTTKVLDTDLLWFYVRTYNLRVTDLMQGPVYGLSTEEADIHKALCPNFHYDDMFGTLVNRFIVQAVAGVPLTIYGKGGQKRGYLNLKDTLQCVRLAADNPADLGELKIYNQLTETFSVLDVAEKIQKVGLEMGLDVTTQNLDNPRKEKEEHYYNPTHTGLVDLGLKPHFMSDAVIAEMIERVLEHKENIHINRIMPRVSWK